MKLKLMTMVSVLFCSLGNPAFAGNEGPAGLPANFPVSPPLAELQIMSLSPRVPSQLYQIDQNGNAYFIPSTGRQLLATLPQAGVQQIQDQIESMTVGELIDTAPQSPKCMGAPSQEFRAMKADGSVIVFARIVMCHLMILPNSGGDELRKVLSGLPALAQMASGSPAVLSGIWGSQYADLTADQSGVSIRMGCAEARIPNEVVLDAQGGFEADGTETHGGGAEPVGGYIPTPVHFSGHVNGDQLDITISNPGPNLEPAQVLHFQFGVTINFPVCA
jgi:hypothetical protein